MGFLNPGQIGRLPRRYEQLKNWCLRSPSTTSNK